MEGPRKKLKLPVQILPLKSGAQGETYAASVYFRIRKQDIMCLYICLDGKEIGLRCESWGIEKKQNVKVRCKSKLTASDLNIQEKDFKLVTNEKNQWSHLKNSV